jgi:hypothetical protein
VIFDLSDWNEYIADDVPPGPIPCGVRLECMQIATSDCFRKLSVDDFPTGLEADADTIKVWLFWRLKDDR